MPEESEAGGKSGNHVICFSCGGFRMIGQPRVYVMTVSESFETGDSMLSWRRCPQCCGKGILPGLKPPV